MTMAPSARWRGELADLLASSTSRGWITYDELSQRIAGIEAEPAAMEAVLAMLEAAHIELVDSEPPGRPDPEKPAPVPPSHDHDVPDIVAAYQRDLARIQPLDDEEQLAITARLQEALDGLAAALDGIPDSMADRAPRRQDGGSHGGEPTTVDIYDRAVEWERLTGASEEAMTSCDPSIADQLRHYRSAVDEARGDLVRGTMRLVFHLARRWENRGVELLDLVQEGNAGLLRAARRFDPHRGHSFVSYATWWVREALAKAVREQGKSFKVTPELDGHLKRLNRERRRQSQALGREPSIAELAAAIGVDESHVDRLLHLGAAPLRLDAPTGDGEGSLESILDVGVDSVDASDPDRVMLKAEISRVLESLDPGEGALMRLRFGIDDGVSRSIEEVAASLHTTRERARQIEERALRKLRHPSRRGRLGQLD